MPAARPKQIVPLPNGEIGIAWSDGEESYHDGYALRCACPCASCIDEVTGEKLLEDSKVSRDVRAEQVHPVGNYGVSFVWSDGHATGIYTFERLRRLAGLSS